MYFIEPCMPIVPNLLIYVAATQGFYPFSINESKLGRQNYLVTKPAANLYEQEQNLTVGATTNIRHFAMKNIPAFKIQDYLTSPQNYINKVEFQLSKVANDEDYLTPAAFVDSAAFQRQQCRAPCCMDA